MLKNTAAIVTDRLKRAFQTLTLRLAQPLARLRLAYIKATDRDKSKRDVIVLSMGHLSRASNMCRSAKAKGYCVHVFCQEFPTVEAMLADRVYRVDCRSEFDRALEIARDINPVGILVEAKNLILPMQRHLATALGLRALSENGIEASNSKATLRRNLDSAGLANVPWSVYTPGTPCPIPFPLVLKPDMGTSSKGVVYCASQAELDSSFEGEYMQRLQSDINIGETFIVEGFIKGRQFDVEGIGFDGQYHIFTIVEEFYEAKPPYFPPDWFLFNPPIPPQLRSAIVAGAEAALKAFGVTNGGFHVELRVTDDGTVIPLDFANRLGYNTLVSAAAGVSIVDKFVDFMADGDSSAPEFQPMSLAKIYAKTPERFRLFQKFSRRYPERVFHKNLVGYEFSYHWYYGDMTIKGTDYEDIHDIMSSHDLVPPEFAKFYPRS